MKTAAIIAEYNPFHNGHAYHLRKTREETGADYILVLMSGDFVQRGAPALCNKYVRTKMALLGGADAVIELPALYALSSAEYFSQGAVSLLNRLGCIDLLSFGSECGGLSSLLTAARLLLSGEKDLKPLLDEGLKQGLSFPAARSHALKGVLSEETLSLLLSSPNNVLALEYCKALLSSKSSITPFTLLRKGQGYHDTAFSCSYGKSQPDVCTDDSHGTTGFSSYASASSIRACLNTCFPDLSPIRRELPGDCFSILEKQLSCIPPVSENDFSQLLHYRLLTLTKEELTGFLDCSSSLSAKISGHLSEFTDFTSFCALLKSRELTYTRISRSLFHILLNIQTPSYYLPGFSERELFTPYARLLGFRKSAAPLLNAIKKNSSIPLLSKPADAESLLSKDGYDFFKQDVFCSSVYETAACQKQMPPLSAGRLMGKKGTALNELKQSPISL